MSDVRINTRSPYYIEANPTAPEVPETPEIPDPPANIPPTVTITASNENPFVGETVTLTAVATDSDGTIVSYLWGGTSLPQTSVSIDVTSTEVQSKIFNVIVTDDDGDIGIAQITINWQEIPEQIINTDIDVECGDVINEASFSGTKTYNLVGVGNKIGDVEVEFLFGGGNQDHPVVFDLSWNGATVTTGYIGHSSQVSGTLPYTDNTGDPSTKTQPTTLTINKSAASPSEVTLTARPLEINDSFSFRLNCPNVLAEITYYYTLTGTCTSGDTTFEYTDVNGDVQTVVLANGETQLISAQEDTVSAAICTGTTEKGGESFDLGTPELTVDQNVEFRIWLDNSGSMGSEIYALRDMTEYQLKDSFLEYYEGSSSQYNKQVSTIIQPELYTDDEVKSWQERFLLYAAQDPQNATSSKVVNMIWVDEASNSGDLQSGYHHFNSLGDNTLTTAYLNDLAVLRSSLDAQATYGDKLVVVFCVEKDYNDDFKQFSHFIDNVTTGANGFDGSNGLSDRSDVIFVRNVLPGQSASYYHQATIDALTDLGFNI